MKTEVLKIINDIQAGKQKRKMYPDYALKIEILHVARKRIERAIDELAAEGKVKKGSTINDIYVEPLTEER